MHVANFLFTPRDTERTCDAQLWLKRETKQTPEHLSSVLILSCCFSVMVAELKILLSVEEDLSDLEELRALIKKIKAVVWKGREKEVDNERTRSESPQTAEYSEVNAVGGFGGKNTGKPDPWDGDTEHVNTVPPIQKNFMKNGYDENNGYGKVL